MADLEQMLQFLEDTFRVSEYRDYPSALNGLQVQGPPDVHRMAVAVDASEVTIRAAVEREAQLLIVHHGLFWDGLGPLTGPRFRKAHALLTGSLGLYSLHLPLDAHPELGNCALLCRAMGLEPTKPFGHYQDVPIGWWATTNLDREALKNRLSEAVGGKVHLVAGGPEVVDRVGVLTGAGGSAIREAAETGLHSLVTGEAAHHHYHDAIEYGVNLYLGGHYATETFGVKALGAAIADRFGLEWEFLDYPTGL
jgi:dinuclear metal center YbgI/SA1388 family protein